MDATYTQTIISLIVTSNSNNNLYLNKSLIVFIIGFVFFHKHEKWLSRMKNSAKHFELNDDEYQILTKHITLKAIEKTWKNLFAQTRSLYPFRSLFDHRVLSTSSNYPNFDFDPPKKFDMYSIHYLYNIIILYKCALIKFLISKFLCVMKWNLNFISNTHVWNQLKKNKYWKWILETLSSLRREFIIKMMRNHAKNNQSTIMNEKFYSLSLIKSLSSYLHTIYASHNLHIKKIFETKNGQCSEIKNVFKI